jgi:hypothetical protein
MVRLIPPKTICEEFSLVYELEGAQKAINFLSKYYKIKQMKIIVDGRRAGRNNLAYYLENGAYFTKNGLKRKIVLHEFYHHLVFCKKIISDKEEREADDYARRILGKL